MKQIAFHRLHLVDGKIITPAVVTFDDQGSVLDWHQLTVEEANTEWKGEDYYLR